MKDEAIDQETKKVLPRWLVMIVIMATAGITAAALSATGLKGPSVAWDRANKTVAGVWTGDQAPANGILTPGQPGAGFLSATAPQPTAMTNGPSAPTQPVVAAQPVAAIGGAPVIVWGTPIGHGDRGACTNCHTVVFPQGTPLPTISALSSMPHEFRGVCNNCHQVRVRGLGLTAVAGGPSPAVVGQGAGQRQPTEAEWRGLEVGISTAGVVVNGADGVAKRAGIKVGDIVTSVNAIATPTVADFVRATENGALSQGAVIVRRDGQRLAFELARNPPERERNNNNNNGGNNNGERNNDGMQPMPMQSPPMQMAPMQMAPMQPPVGPMMQQQQLQPVMPAQPMMMQQPPAAMTVPMQAQPQARF